MAEIPKPARAIWLVERDHAVFLHVLGGGGEHHVFPLSDNSVGRLAVESTHMLSNMMRAK